MKITRQMGKVTITIEVRLPFWWQDYLSLLWLCECAGILMIDHEAAGNFILRHSRWRIDPRNKWNKFTEAYKEC